MNETRRTLHARSQSGEEEHPVLNAPSSFFSTVRLHARIEPLAINSIIRDRSRETRLLI